VKISPVRFGGPHMRTWSSDVGDMSTGTTTDIQRLLDRLGDGDTSARADLLNRAHDRLVKIASTIFRRDFRGLHGRHDIESVVDEAWIGLMRALESTRPESVEGFVGLVVVKVRQTLLQIARRERRHDAHRVAGRPEAGDSDSPELFERADLSNEPGHLALLGELHQQVELLPEPEKTVFGLHYYLGLSQVETAQIMELPPWQVSRIWLRATNRLARWLKDAEGLR
jgi:RNA polymerase sigma factor (sigma-70 family)